MEIAERALFRVTRDADFEVSDDADDLLEAVEIGAPPAPLRRRRPARGLGVGLAGDARSAAWRASPCRPDQVYEIEGLLDQADLWQLVALDRPDLKHEPWAPVTPPRWARAKTPHRVFDEIRRGDLLVHQPYDSFRASFEAFAEAAAHDPDVIAIKTTVYRTSDDSALVSSLIECAEEGKQSVCLVELKARFDERRNIEWSRAMEQAGVHVVHGFPDLKIHAKMTLVVRREAGRAPPLRPHRHRQLQRLDGAHLRGRRALHRRRGDRRRRRRPLQLRHGLRAPAALPQAPRRAVHDAGAARRGDPTRSPTAAADGKTGAHPPEAERARRPDDDRGAVRGLGRRGGDRDPARARSACCDPASRASPRRSASARSSAASSSTAGSTGSRRATRRAVFLGSADLMPRNLDRRIEVLAPVENARARGGDRGDPRQRVRGHDERLGARRGRHLGPPRAAKAKKRARRTRRR